MPGETPKSEQGESKERLRRVLNSDRASLSPPDLAELQHRIAQALHTLLETDPTEIEFIIHREKEQRVLELRVPVKSFFKDQTPDNSLTLVPTGKKL